MDSGILLGHLVIKPPTPLTMSVWGEPVRTRIAITEDCK